MDDASKQAVSEWLDSKVGTITCPVCRAQNDWIAGELVETKLCEGNPEGTKVLPFVPVTCGNCANTLFFHAVHMGLLEEYGEVGA